MLQRLRNGLVRERKCIQACQLICCAHGEGRTPPADSAPLNAPPGSVLKLPPQKVHYQQSKFLEVAPGMRPARPRQAAAPACSVTLRGCRRTMGGWGAAAQAEAAKVSFYHRSAARQQQQQAAFVQKRCAPRCCRAVPAPPPLPPFVPDDLV